MDGSRRRARPGQVAGGRFTGESEPSTACLKFFTLAVIFASRKTGRRLARPCAGAGTGATTCGLAIATAGCPLRGSQRLHLIVDGGERLTCIHGLGGHFRIGFKERQIFLIHPLQFLRCWFRTGDIEMAVLHEIEICIAATRLAAPGNLASHSETIFALAASVTPGCCALLEQSSKSFGL
jgi:hypothetical protein